MATPPTGRPTAAARIAAAIQRVDWPHDLAAFTARQTTPILANARQTTPSATPAQNEPSSADLPDPGAMPSLAAEDATSPTHPPGEGRDASRATALQTLPNHANAPHDEARRKTNPPAQAVVPRPRPPRPLTPNQLRAARLLIAGHSTTQISATLHIDRHTLATWKRLPLFQQELRQLLSTHYNPAPHI